MMGYSEEELNDVVRRMAEIQAKAANTRDLALDLKRLKANLKHTDDEEEMEALHEVINDKEQELAHELDEF